MGPDIDAGPSTERFSIVDYVVLGLLLGLSAGVGVFYGLIKKHTDSNDFLMAGKSMGTLPVALSLLTSFLSGIALLGLPSEVYTFGTSIWMLCLSYFIVMPVTAFVFVPVFWNLQMTLYMAVVVYAPALALIQVVGIDFNISVVLTCLVCIFYTALGGMKAVIWTDVLQAFFMYGSFIIVLIQGTISAGGFWEVWERTKAGDRLQIFTWDFDLTMRYTFWSVTVGNAFMWLFIFATNQAQVQRYLSVKEKYMAVNALWINMIGVPVLTIMCVYAGMLSYATYWNCDPRSVNKISKEDQILPLFVIEVLGKWNGVPGLFVAALFAGTLSTVSSGINAMAAICLKDFVLQLFPDLTPITEMRISKVLSLVFGLITFGLVFIMDKMGDMYSITISMFGILGGPLLGIFALGMLFPWANRKGATVGIIAGLAIAVWLGGGSQVMRLQGRAPQPTKPISTEGCHFHNITFNESASIILTTSEDDQPVTLSSPTSEDEEVFIGYRLSYSVFAGIGCISVIVIGLVSSLLTGGQDIKKLDRRTITPFVLWILAKLNVLQDLGADVELEMDKIADQPEKYIGMDNLAYTDTKA